MPIAIAGNLCNICAMEKSYWHICTDGLAREIIFKDVKDYIFGMNGVPALSLSYDITVLAFCLMSNHVNKLFRKSSYT